MFGATHVSLQNHSRPLPKTKKCEHAEVAAQDAGKVGMGNPKIPLKMQT